MLTDRDLRGAPPPARTVAAAPPDRVADPDGLIDRAGMAAEVTALLSRESARPATPRPDLFALIKSRLAAARAEVRRRFEVELIGGEACMASQCYVMDVIIDVLVDVADGHLYHVANPTAGDRLCIVATGGYGRGELAPFSDIDLLFLTPYKPTPRVEQVVEFCLYTLWDLGLKVGHAVRSLEECLRWARDDMTVRTTVMEGRLLNGDGRLFHTFRQRLQREVISGSAAGFIEAKLAERTARHHKLGDSRYLLEPNIKEGKGGLRDLQLLGWIGRYLHRSPAMAEMVKAGLLTEEEERRAARAAGFLATLRCHLHYLADRPEERLTFDVQPEIGRRMGYSERDGAAAVERFMKHYFLIAKSVGDLTRTVLAGLEAEHLHRGRRGLRLWNRQQTEDGFVIDGSRLGVAAPDQFERAPADLIRVFLVAQQRDRDLQPATLKLISRSRRLIDANLRDDPEANAHFLEILTGPHDPEYTLRRMNEAGVLGRFVPDFGRVVAQMQYDMYHVFTVDEHTVVAVGLMHRLAQGKLAETLPHASEVMDHVLSRRPLLVAMLLHDIAKGRGGDHSVLGSRIARRLCPRLGLTAEETETVEWLVLYHLTMSDAAFKRDIEDDKTVRDFAELVGSVERLRQLYVLTICDIKAVGPGRWTPWKGTLLRALFERTQARLSGGFEAIHQDDRVRTAQGRVRDRLQALGGWAPEEIETFLSAGYPSYWLSLDTDTHVHHAELTRAAHRQGQALTVERRVIPDMGVTELTVYAGDHPGLFAHLAGALAVAGANIIETKAFTHTDGMALDVFLVQDAATGGPLEAGEKLARLSALIARSLEGVMIPGDELQRRRPAYRVRSGIFRVPPRVLVDNAASHTHTVIEINGRDRPGLLFDVTHALSAMALQISSAKISTYGERAVDVFYVKDVFGMKITHEQRIAEIRDRLEEAVGGATPTAAAPEQGSPARAESPGRDWTAPAAQ